VQSRLAGTPGGRWGRPEDIAGPAVFLCSAASQFVTGEMLVVDGVRCCHIPLYYSSLMIVQGAMAKGPL
jgi:NAD(P)-dependent dehydrogenase (short-subunit alcohol dehydrogenase family)